MISILPCHNDMWLYCHHASIELYAAAEGRLCGPLASHLPPPRLFSSHLLYRHGMGVTARTIAHPRPSTLGEI